MTPAFPLMLAEATTESAPALGVTCPYDAAIVGTVALTDANNAELALKTAYATFRDRAGWLPVARRLEILDRAADLMATQLEDLALLAASEGGKPLVDSRVEAVRALEGVRLAAEALRTQSGNMYPMNVNPASANRIAFTQHEPIGVVVAVSAFNHPLNLIVHQVAPALAAGCPVIVKPAAVTPLSCCRFVELLYEAGLPQNWCQVAVTVDNDVASQLVTDSRNAFFSFIGSAGVGWMLRSRLAPGTRCALEHGGVAPVIVAEDADLEATLPALLKGGFYHAGQVCVSVQRVFAAESIAEEVAAQLARGAMALRVGDPRLAETEVGPLIRQQEVDRVGTWVNDATVGGARCLSGGHALENQCYAPTVLVDPPQTATISRQEAFGPVVCVYPYESMDNAIARANDVPFAFQASVFTRDLDGALAAYRGLDAAAVMINDHSAFRVDWMPFAGLKQSGHGVGGIHFTFEDMQIEKMAVIRSASL